MKSIQVVKNNHSDTITNYANLKTRIIGFSMTYKIRLQEHNIHLKNEKITAIINQIDELMRDLIK